MTTLIVGEKPSTMRKIAQYLPSHLEPNDTYVVHTWMTGPAKFKFKRGRALREYPCIDEPVLELDNDPKFHARALSGAETITVPDLVPRLSRIIYACDPDATGIWAFRSALQVWADVEASAKKYDAWLFGGLDETSMRSAMVHGTTTSELDAAYDYAKTKRYFEYQWLNNAHVVLGSAMRAVGVTTGVPSKFALQVLYFIQCRQNNSVSGLVHRMEHWEGTGRYEEGTLGSPASRPTILTQLQELGLLSKGPLLSCTEVGHAFLARLHPDCQDLDLPQRLHAWGSAGLVASKPGMDRYIRTFFGKQLRYA